MVTFGALGLHFGRSWKPLGIMLRSFGVILVPRVSKMGTLRDLADTVNTLENCRFLFIFEGWRLSKTVSGSSWKLAGALDSAAGWLDAIWVAG